MDAILLARMQFAANITFHILWPAKVAPVFRAFGIPVGVGMRMRRASWVGLWLWLYRRRGRVAEWLPHALLGGLALMSFSGWVATVAGWYVTEIGRQPYRVQGLLRVDEWASAVPAAHIGLRLALYVTVYLALRVAFVRVLAYMADKRADLPAVPAPDTPLPGAATVRRVLQ